MLELSRVGAGPTNTGQEQSGAKKSKISNLIRSLVSRAGANDQRSRRYRGTCQCSEHLEMTSSVRSNNDVTQQSSSSPTQNSVSIYIFYNVIELNRVYETIVNLHSWFSLSGQCQNYKSTPLNPYLKSKTQIYNY